MKTLRGKTRKAFEKIQNEKKIFLNKTPKAKNLKKILMDLTILKLDCK